MVGDRHGYGGVVGPLLHHHVAAALTYLCEAMFGEDATDIGP
jgi:hypothetical protein